MSDEKKRFEDWKKVDCEDCQRWWLNECDGVNASSKGSGRLCNSYLATRKVVLPHQIKKLQRAIKWLTGVCVIFGVLMIYILLNL